MAYDAKVAMGLTKIEVGEPTSGGAEATTFTTLGYTDPDSCSVDTDDPEVTDVNAEEVDDPILSISKGGKSTLNFNVLNPDGDALEMMMGGTYDTSTHKWSAGSALVQPELSVKITTNTGYVFHYPRVKFTCKYSGSFGKSEPIKLACSGTILVPLDTSTKKMYVVFPTA